MKKQRMIIALLLCMMASSGAFAQLSKLKRARMHMEDLNYMGAIELYNQILEKNDNPEAKINIAEAYRKINDAENAEYWYGQVVQLAEAEPVHKLFYGQMLQRNGKCDLAKEWYQAYVEAVPEDQRGQYLVQACDYEDELRTKNAGIYEILHVDFNSNLDDFSPAFYDDGIVFATERDKGVAIARTHEWTGNPFNELFIVKRKKASKDAPPGEYEYDRPEKYSKRLNSKYHDAAVTFSPDQSKIYFTRNNILNGKTTKDDEGIVRLKVFSAVIDGDEWKDLEGLPFNSDEYSVAHPTLTADGERMFFASDMPGGFGGMDLYISSKDGGRWGPPINLGARINTEGNEIFPYYDQQGKLFFASDGQVGLGGLDIYYMEDKGEGEFGEIVNMGYPINTIADDFGVIFDEEGKEGYFSSDREGGAGRDDIYAFRKSAATMEILVYDEVTKEPIEGASVVNDCTGNTMTTDKEGKIKFDMKLDQCCNFTASMEEYLDNEKEGCTTGVEMGGKAFVEIPMRKELEFKLDGIVMDQSTGLPIEGAMVTLSNDCGDEELLEMLSDAKGNFSFNLKPDCCYTIRATAEGYFGNPVENQCTRDLDETTTLQAVVNLNPISTTPTNPDGNPLTGGGDPNTDPFNPDPQDIAALPEPIYDDETGKNIDPRTGEPINGRYRDKTYIDGEEIDNPGGGVETGFPSNPNSNYGDGKLAYLLHIYYDFDQSYLREEATPELEKLCTMMRENSDLIIEISSHTDSRGSFRYNRSLSQRRAESVVRWLVDCGIDRDRLVPRGYGETKNVNNCVNNIPCSEREHQLNRRTEFRVIGCISCQQGDALSKPNQNPIIDECQGCPF